MNWSNIRIVNDQAAAALVIAPVAIARANAQTAITRINAEAAITRINAEAAITRIEGRGAIIRISVPTAAAGVVARTIISVQAKDVIEERIQPIFNKDI